MTQQWKKIKKPCGVSSAHLWGAHMHGPLWSAEDASVFLIVHPEKVSVYHCTPGWRAVSCWAFCHFPPCIGEWDCRRTLPHPASWVLTSGPHLTPSVPSPQGVVMQWVLLSLVRHNNWYSLLLNNSVAALSTMIIFILLIKKFSS